MSVTLPLKVVQNIARNAELGVNSSDSRDPYNDHERRGYLYLQYSGRGMCGDTCLGLVGDQDDYARFVAEAREGYEGVDPDLFTGSSRDSMGLDMIFYWQGVKVDRNGQLGEDDYDEEEA